MKHYVGIGLTLLLAWLPATGVAAEETKPIVSVGTLNRLDVNTGTVNIGHEPVPALGWPATTMDFRVADVRQLKNLKSGDRVKFTLQPRGDQYLITDIRSAR